MQCPNCHKEAINVNGKYVCLDCGIEISPNDAPLAPPVEPTQPISNFGGALNPNPQVGEPEASDTVQPPTTSETPTFESIQPPVEVAPEPPIERPITEEIANELSLSEEPTLTDPVAPTPVSSGGVLPDFPTDSPSPGIAPDNFAQPLAPAPEIETPAPASSVPDFQVPAPQSDPSPSLNSDPNPFDSLVDQAAQPSIAHTEPPLQAPVEPLPATPAEQSYFQPSQMDIKPSQPMNIDPVVSPEAPVSQFDSTVAPSTPEPSTLQAPASPVAPQAQVTFPDGTVPTPNLATPAAAPALDDLLGQSIPNIGVAATPAVGQEEPLTDIFETQNPAPSFDAVQPSPAYTPATPADSAAQIPSYESVFGGQGQPAGGITAVKPSLFQRLFTKTNLIIGGIILAVLLVGTIGILVFNATRNNEPEPIVDEVDQAVISQRVQDAMEVGLNASVSYDQTVSFDGVTLAEETASTEESQKVALSVLKNKVTNSGTWEVSATGDASVDSIVNGAPEKKIYNKSANLTYNLNPATDAWENKEGFLIDSVPGFYAPTSRAKLFYVAQSEKITALPKEELDGVSYEKYQISPKADYVQAIISASHPALSGVEFENIGLDNLTVFAWINDEGRIVKVSVTGEIAVSSTIFKEGSVISIESEANYEYLEEIKIEKPETTASATPAPAPVAQKPTNDVELPPTVIKVSETESENTEDPTDVNSPKDKGRG